MSAEPRAEQGPGPADEARESAARAKNRAALGWIVVLCVIMGALGFLFALWLRGRPAG